MVVIDPEDGATPTVGNYGEVQSLSACCFHQSGIFPLGRIRVSLAGRGD